MALLCRITKSRCPERFAGAGYHTWLVGRRQLAGVSNWTTEHARPYEYAHFDWAHGPLHRSRQNAYLNWLRDKVPDQYASIFPHQADPDDTDIPPNQRAAMRQLPDDLSFNHWVGQQVTKRIMDRPADKPFLGIAGFVVGDTMGAPSGSGPHIERVDECALAQADQAIDGIMKAANTLPNTILAVIAARGSSASDGGMLSPDTLRVPLLINGLNGPTCQDDLIAPMDLAPTLYECAQVPPPPRIQGQSLLSTPPRGWALSRLRHSDVPRQTALTTAQWKLVVTHDDRADLLYDLTNDPTEENNLAADQKHQCELDAMLDMMIDARVALEDRTEPRVALF